MRMLCLTALLGFVPLTSCQRRGPILIAVIPRTTGTSFWEPLQGGAELQARGLAYALYWNGPARDDDFEGQIALVNQEIDRNVQGLILAPSQSLALITPVRRALAHGIPTVIVSSGLDIPPESRLTYILNDEEMGASMCGKRILRLTSGHGSVVLLGVDLNLAAMRARIDSIERYLRDHAPEVRIIKRFGNPNALQEQQIAHEVLREQTDLKVIVGLMSGATDGALAAMHGMRPASTTRIIGFDPNDAPPMEDAYLDSFIVQDTRTMGERAVRQLADALDGRPVPLLTRVPPLLLTRESQEESVVWRLLRQSAGPFAWERP